MAWAWLSSCLVYSLARTREFRTRQLHLMVSCCVLLAVLLHRPFTAVPDGEVRDCPSPIILLRDISLAYFTSDPNG